MMVRVLLGVVIYVGSVIGLGEWADGTDAPIFLSGAYLAILLAISVVTGWLIGHPGAYALPVVVFGAYAVILSSGDTDSSSGIGAVLALCGGLVSLLGLALGVALSRTGDPDTPERPRDPARS